MPEPLSISTDLWCLKGSADETGRVASKEGTKHEHENNQLLLHRLFEKFLDDAANAAKKRRKVVDSLNEGLEMPDLVPRYEVPASPTLTEYDKGVDVENMERMTYEVLNEQSNFLARTLLRKLGKLIVQSCLGKELEISIKSQLSLSYIS